MCSFGSCQTRFEFLSQFRKVRNAFECFVTQVQTHLPKTKRVWPMKINVICTVVFGNSLTKRNKISSFSYFVVICFLPLAHIPPCYHANPPDFPRLIGPRDRGYASHVVRTLQRTL